TKPPLYFWEIAQICNCKRLAIKSLKRLTTYGIPFRHSRRRRRPSQFPSKSKSPLLSVKYKNLCLIDEPPPIGIGNGNGNTYLSDRHGLPRRLLRRLFDFLESAIVCPQNPPPYIFHDRSVSPLLIDEFVPVVKFSDIVVSTRAGFPSECCAVCLCEFQDDEELRFLKNCKHIFHKKCLDRWMIRDQRSCPLCRTLIVPEESIPPLMDFPGCSEFFGDYN
ncbi:uncharacterized RING finger protein P4H10.07-like, partial [Cucurbita maxima]|uniref:Uncharacterized RING finger protein P4H10.07-like n=1 Tax=Cucurbita maxima TaxID=3661 RepID=A0A6J1IKV5_CUCMA